VVIINAKYKVSNGKINMMRELNLRFVSVMFVVTIIGLHANAEFVFAHADDICTHASRSMQNAL